MYQNRSRFLNQTGAVRDDDGIALHFGELPRAIDEPVTAFADHWRLIKLRGPGTDTFLQGQVTADVRDVRAGFSRTAMHLSLKGRGLVSMRLLPANDGIDILVPTGRAAQLLALLKKYIVFSKATLALEEDACVLALSGDGASETLARVGLPIPGPDDGCALTDGITLVNPGVSRRYLLVLPFIQAIALWAPLCQGRTGGGAQHVQLAEIAAGEGHVLPGAEDLFMPQALNYDLTHGVSFNKGCYTGQEVVARVKFKGQMKQRLFHLSWPGDTAPSPGTVLRDAQDHALGNVVVTAPCGARTHALAVLRLDHDGDCYLNSVPLQTQIEGLPYAR